MNHRSKLVRSLTGLVLTLSLHAAQAGAPALAMISDIEGQVWLRNRDTTTALQLGDTLNEGDILSVSSRATATIVYFSNCTEWLVKENDEVKLVWKGPVSKAMGTLKPVRELPVCYRPEDFKGLDNHVIGGYVMRELPAVGMVEMENLRREAMADKASGATLMTVMIHDLRSRQPERARPYYEKLKQRYPNTGLVKSFSGYFDEAARK